MFFVGQKVTCVNDSRWPHRSMLRYVPSFPKKGATYKDRRDESCPVALRRPPRAVELPSVRRQ